MICDVNKVQTKANTVGRHNMKGNETALVVAPIAADVVSDINWQTGETEEDIGVLLASSNLRSVGETE